MASAHQLLPEGSSSMLPPSPQPLGSAPASAWRSSGPSTSAMMTPSEEESSSAMAVRSAKGASPT